MTVDFTRSLPPRPPELDAALAGTLAELAGAGGAELLHASVPGGSAADREAAAGWLAPRLGAGLDPDRVLLTNGTQTSLLLLMRRYGGPVLAEALTYSVISLVADHAGVELVAVPIDDEGLDPGALDELCRRHRPRLLYANPTCHNPTTATMSTGRRHAVAAVARRHGLRIFEDDVTGALHPAAPPPIAAVAPDLTWYSMGLTKCLAQGLRIGYLVGPDPAEAAWLAEPVRRLSHWTPSPLTTGLLRRWITGGHAATVTAAIRAESARRQRVAAEVLAGRAYRAEPDALHLWLHAPVGDTARSYAARAGDAGVRVRPADAFTVAGHPPPPWVRLSLSTPPHADDVRSGLTRLARIG